MSEPAPSFRKYELQEGLEEATKRLLPSQKAFVFAPERFSCISGGFASGKSFAGVLKGVILSAAIPGNVGSFLCYRGSDVEKRLIPLFLEEACPRSWVKSYNKNKRVVVLRNNSVISFRPHQGLCRAVLVQVSELVELEVTGAGSGVDQGEEIEKAHWDALCFSFAIASRPKEIWFCHNQSGGP
jgi:hypothetical protein